MARPKKKTEAALPAGVAALTGPEGPQDDAPAERAIAKAPAKAEAKVDAEAEAQAAYDRHIKHVESHRPIAPRLQREEAVVNHWALTVMAGTSRAMLTEPRYWANVAQMLRPYDEITVRSDDGTIYGRYLVLACDRLWARVEELDFRLLTSSDISMTQAAAMARAGFEIRHMGPHLLWSVIRKSDAARLSAGHQQEADAESWVRQHIRTVGAGQL